MGYLKSAGLKAALIVANTVSKFVNENVVSSSVTDEASDGPVTRSPTSSPTGTAMFKESAVLSAVSTLESGLQSMMVF
jgi:hypothetical protein